MCGDSRVVGVINRELVNSQTMRIRLTPRFIEVLEETADPRALTPNSSWVLMGIRIHAAREVDIVRSRRGCSSILL